MSEKLTPDNDPCPLCRGTRVLDGAPCPHCAAREASRATRQLGEDVAAGRVPRAVVPWQDEPPNQRPFDEATRRGLGLPVTVAQSSPGFTVPSDWLRYTGVDLAATPAEPAVTILRGFDWELRVEGADVSDEEALAACREVEAIARRLRGAR